MKLLTAEIGWAQSGGHLYWTIDNGKHWRVIDPGTSKLSIVDAYFLDTNKGWALLSGEAPNGAGAEFDLASTADGGGKWHIAHVKLPPLDKGSMALNGAGTVFFVDSQHGWMNLPAVSNTAFRGGYLSLTEDGGKTWKWASGGSGAGGGTVYFVTAEDGWTAGGPGDQQLNVTHDGAKSWHEVTLEAPPIITKEYTASYVVPIFRDRKHGFLPVTYTAGDDHEAVLVLYSSSDGGLTWKTDRTFTKRGYLSGENVPATIADSVLLAAPSSSDGSIQLTVAPNGANGRTIVARVSSRHLAVTQLSFVDPSRGWISTSDGLFSTQDAGVTWTNITPPAHTSGALTTQARLVVRSMFQRAT